jgi:thiol-disulfide isomerase/thioredoxin
VFLESHAQVDSLSAPFKKFPSYPPVKLLLPDSVSYYSKSDLPKKSPVLIMLFNPECDHCRHETEEIIKHIDEFKDVEIVMATMMPFNTMIEFRNKYKLDQYKNIIVGQDIHYFLPTFFAVRNLPFLAFYNGNKEYIDSFEGSMPIERVIETIHK